MLDGPRLPEEFMDKLGGIDDIEEVKFSPECSTQAKPAVLVLIPRDGVDTDRLEDVAVRLREVLQRGLDGLQTDVKASIEHPVTTVERDDGVYPDTVEDEHIIKLRYRQTTIGGLSRTRLNGYAVDKGLPEGEE